jgi:hypothetical protein
MTTNDNPTPKRPKGKPLGFRKPDALRAVMKLRWRPEELEEVKTAAHAAGEDTSEFIRTAALNRARNDEQEGAE